MKSLKGTRTSENLLKAFAGESQARNRYTYYSSVAKKEGYVNIANIFIETAENEKAHAKRFFNFLCTEYAGDSIVINADYPVGLKTTKENLEYAASGEYEEWTNLYPTFGDIAEEEGFIEVAKVFRNIAQIEINHEKRFNSLLDEINKNSVFEKEEEVEWICSVCGHVHRGKKAPEACPVCLHAKAFFQVNKVA